MMYCSNLFIFGGTLLFSQHIMMILIGIISALLQPIILEKNCFLCHSFYFSLIIEILLSSVIIQYVLTINSSLEKKKKIKKNSFLSVTFNKNSRFNPFY